MKRFSKFVEDKMPAGQRGLDYEFKIYNAIKKAKVNFLKKVVSLQLVFQTLVQETLKVR